MGRLNPRYDEFFHENISNFLGSLIDKIKKVKKEPDEITEDFINEYYRKHDKIQKEFSVGLLDSVKKYIFDVVTISKKYLPISDKMKERLITCCLDLFIEDCVQFGYSDFKDLEISDEEYYLDTINYLQENLSSSNSRLEQFLSTSLSLKWQEIIESLELFKANKIKSLQFLKECFSLFGEKRFIRRINRFKNKEKFENIEYKFEEFSDDIKEKINTLLKQHGLEFGDVWELDSDEYRIKIGVTEPYYYHFGIKYFCIYSNPEINRIKKIIESNNPGYFENLILYDYDKYSYNRKTFRKGPPLQNTMYHKDTDIVVSNGEFTRFLNSREKGDYYGKPIPLTELTLALMMVNGQNCITFGQDILFKEECIKNVLKCLGNQKKSIIFKIPKKPDYLTISSDLKIEFVIPPFFPDIENNDDLW